MPTFFEKPNTSPTDQPINHDQQIDDNDESNCCKSYVVTPSFAALGMYVGGNVGIVLTDSWLIPSLIGASSGFLLGVIVYAIYHAYGESLENNNSNQNETKPLLTP